MKESDEIAVIVLAAGESSRMGKPKQLLQLQGKSLLRRAAETALASELGPVVVVLGAFHEQIEAELKGLTLQTAVNPDWQQGMGTSIRCGIQQAEQHHAVLQGAIIMLADQPYASPALLKDLLRTHLSSQKPVIASAYKGTLGVPAYFHKSYFTTLRQLEGKHGARYLIQQHSQDAGAVPFPLGGMDVDTPEDYELIKERMKREQ